MTSCRIDRCLCGELVLRSSVKTFQQNLDSFCCHACNIHYHSHCVRQWYEGQNEEVEKDAITANRERRWLCPQCRLRFMDQFCPVITTIEATKYISPKTLELAASESDSGPNQGRHSITFTIDGTNLRRWQEGKMEVHLRCIRNDWHDFSGPSWPHEARIYLNDKEICSNSGAFPAIEQPQMGHCRKEVGFINLSLPQYNLNSGINTLRFEPKIYNKRQKLEDGMPSKHFLLGLFAVRPQNWQILKAKTIVSIHAGCEGSNANHRIQEYLKKRNSNDEDLQVISENADAESKSISLLCPVSRLPIELPVIGKYCTTEHLQTYDMDSFLQVQAQTKNLNQRWKCPICGLRARSFDLRLCRYTKYVIEQAKIKAKSDYETKKKNKIDSRKLTADQKSTDEDDDDSDDDENAWTSMIPEKVLINDDCSYTFTYEQELKKEREKRFGDVLDVEDVTGVDGTGGPSTKNQKLNNGSSKPIRSTKNAVGNGESGPIELDSD